MFLSYHFVLLHLMENTDQNNLFQVGLKSTRTEVDLMLEYYVLH